jgi:hypothetical protein
MAGPVHDYQVLASPWNEQWDVFVLDATDGLIGATVADTSAAITAAALQFLQERPEHRRYQPSLSIIFVGPGSGPTLPSGPRPHGRRAGRGPSSGSPAVGAATAMPFGDGLVGHRP